MTHKTVYPYPVNQDTEPNNNPYGRKHANSMIISRKLSDKASLLRPLQDEHLLEVYREAKILNLSQEFIELLEEAIAIRKLINTQQS
ncbi:MAG: sporulation histidine kinase inhibitor Sda [Candidatus Cohnella colombiensis]|uniref:Sporulation histidine kinase inhibitor Sda n=1 Tax=Candidatus Cohnella colombiensis TaxID=3121368 RepID=A0AA95JG47_9BACL|nr:MAG: sporulation histidine kinase inhibitor Sda [Cohnella sp.]